MRSEALEIFLRMHGCKFYNAFDSGYGTALRASAEINVTAFYVITQYDIMCSLNCIGIVDDEICIMLMDDEQLRPPVDELALPIVRIQWTYDINGDPTYRCHTISRGSHDY